MKVFLSWSGTRSRDAALLFRDWLPQVIQAVDPWMSDVDIEKGAQWFAEISREVSASSFGIVFLTRENLEKPWLHFEAGALAKALSPEGAAAPRVAAYLLGIEPTDVVGPLKEFQHTKATPDDTLKLLSSLNASLASKGEKALKDEMLKSIFATFWPSLGDRLNGVIAKKAAEKPRRDVRDMVEEILEYVRPRAQARERASVTEAALAQHFASANERHRVLQARLIDLERQLKSSNAARAQFESVRQATDAEEKKAMMAAEAVRLDQRYADLAAQLERAKAEFIQNEATLITLREQLAQVRVGVD